MKNLIRLMLIIISFISCKKQEDIKIKEDDIIKIVYSGDGETYYLLENRYILDDRYKYPGNHEINFSKNQIQKIKEKIIEERIFELRDSLRYIKSCDILCYSRIEIEYKQGRKQVFIFDNYNYASDFNNRNYTKIIELEKLILHETIKIIGKPQMKQERID